MQDDSAFGEACALGYTPSGAKIRGGRAMAEKANIKKWQKAEFFFGVILPIAIAAGATAFPLLYLFHTLREWGLLGKLDAEVMRNLILTIAGSITWLFLYRRAKSADQSAQSAEQNAKSAEQGVTIERLTRSMEQLASESPSIRLGGILGLEQIANSHEEEREKIVQILSARIRELAPITDDELSLERRHRLDMEVAVNTLSRIASKVDIEKKSSLCNLQKTNLDSLELSGDSFKPNLSFFDFSNASLRGTRLMWAKLYGTELNGADLHSAELGKAFLKNAGLYKSNLSKAGFFEANLRCARMNEANLSGASLMKVNLIGARLVESNLSGASLLQANLSSADFQNAKGLFQEQLDQAYCWKGHPPHNLPDGLKPPPEIDPPEKFKPEEQPPKIIEIWQ